MTEDYTPTPAECMMARHIDLLQNLLMTGKLDGIGICAVKAEDGAPSFVYLNKADAPVLRPALNKLLGLYEAGQQFKGRVNAPANNRSYLEH